jgi:FkbM family methyltransferase
MIYIEHVELDLDMVLSSLKEIKGIIHVGAADSKELPVYRKYTDNIIMIDALEENKKYNPDLYVELIFNHALNATFNVMNDPLCSSILSRSRRNTNGYEQSLIVEESRSLTPITLDEFFSKYRLSPSDYNFLNLDVEGAEGQVLAGMKRSLVYFDGILAECSDVPRYTNGASYEQLQGYLLSKGLAEAIRGGIYDHVGWHESFFVKENNYTPPSEEAVLAENQRSHHIEKKPLW